MDNVNTIRILSTKPRSACLTVTEDYFMVSGEYYCLLNWTVKKRKGKVSIVKHEILDMNFVSIRSKKIVLCFVLLVSIFIIFGKSLFDFVRIVCSTGRINFNNRIITGLLNRPTAELKVFGIIVIVGIAFWLLLCAGLILVYYLCPLRLFRMTFVGGMIGVKIQNYDRRELECLVAQWQDEKRLV